MKTILTLALVSIFCLQQVNAQQKVKENPPQKVKALFGGNISIGYGVLTGNISEYIGNPFMLPLSAEVLYKGFLFQINIDGGFSKVKKTMTFPDGTSWNDGDQAWHNYFGGGLGYGIINNEKMMVAPVLGYANAYISKKWWGASDIAKHEPSVNYLNVAAFIDLKRKTTDSGANTGKYAAYSGVRVTLGAYIALDDTSPYPEYYNGSSIYFSVGIPVFSKWK